MGHIHVIVTIQTNEKSCLTPQYFYECNNVTDTSSSSSAAISRPSVMGWNNKEIIQKFYEGFEWIPFSFSVDSKLAKVFIGTTPDEVWKKSGFIQKFKGRELIGLLNKKTQEILCNYRVPKLKKYYSINYEFNEREWCAWRSFLQAIGYTDITPWTKEESKFQIWTRESDSTNDKVTLENLYKLGFLVEISVCASNTTQIFWSCQTHTISEARKHARLNGWGMPSRLKFTSEKLEQFEKIFMDKDIANMSSYKSDNKRGLPILYLQDQKQTLRERFHEYYSNDIY
ncbi:1733_t:CDS:2 [Diversispora eburnea]|uniref:1733_t:CDS:1 n=1 Tax=Diversispora eburnea TaxID=1213867 RepID=A0A9N9A141_9GLOM|nr:1733_t:CDS:2 [Diversispora eburnea]